MSIIAKDNSLIEASYMLDLVEQRVILLAIIEAREKELLIEASQMLRISAKSYMDRFGVDKTTAYQVLKGVADSLYNAGFSYIEIDYKTGKRKAKYNSRWVHKIGYVEDEGCLELAFGIDVIPLITRLEVCFTQYNIEQISNLQSRYAVRLYEIIIRWREANNLTPMITLENLRNQLGILEDEYVRMHNFKERVLHLALEQINEFTDIEAKYTQVKHGRKIVGFKFKFKEKPIKENKDPAQLPPPKTQKMSDVFVTMSDSQINTFAPKLSRLSSAGSLAKAGEDYSAFESRIRQELKDPVKQKQYHRFLIELGFKA